MKSSKKVVFGPRICRGKGYPISDMHFQTALTSDHVAGYGWDPFSELGDKRAKKKKKEEDAVVKYKCPNMYVRRPNTSENNTLHSFTVPKCCIKWAAYERCNKKLTHRWIEQN